MTIDDLLGPPVALGDVVGNPASLPEWAWLFTRDRGPVAFSTICRPTVADSRELSEEEASFREATLEENGFTCLLSRSQIEDVIENLLHRSPSPAREELEEAVRFYIEHDAFIVTQ